MESIAGPVGGQPILRDGSPPPPAARQELQRVAREFEALLVGTLLRSLRATVPSSGLVDDEGEIKYYRELHDEELARRMAGTGGLGVAEMIVRRYMPAEAATTALPSDAEDQSDWPLARARAPVPLPPMTKAGRSHEPGAGEVAKIARTMSAGSTSAPGVVEQRVDSTLAQRPRALAAYQRMQVAVAPPAAAAVGGERPASLTPLPALRAVANRLGGVVADSLRRYAPELERAAADTGVDPALLLSVLVHESAGDPLARSPKGALGLMQLMPGTAREVGVSDPLLPGDNIMGGARYLSSLLARFKQDPELAVAGYNAGPGAVAKAGDRLPPYRETASYVRRVISLYERLRDVPGTDLDTRGSE